MDDGTIEWQCGTDVEGCPLWSRHTHPVDQADLVWLQRVGMDSDPVGTMSVGSAQVGR